MTSIKATIGIEIDEKKLRKEIKNELNKLLPRAVPEITQKIRDLIERYFLDSREYKALQAREPLAAHFGFPRGSELARLNPILEKLKNSVQVEFTPLRLNEKFGFSGGYRIKAIDLNYSELLSLPGSTIITEKGEALPWLDWLLTYGNQIIIVLYSIRLGRFPLDISRSGRAIMVRNLAGAWKVPSAYSGTARKNWLTRLIDSHKNELPGELSSIVIGAVSKVV